MVDTSLSETPDLHGAYPRLTDQQIQVLASYGEHRTTQAGDLLFCEGQTHHDFFVILEGMVALTEGSGEDERIVSVHGPGRFLGELGLLEGQTSFLTAVVRAPGAVLAVPVERLRALVAQDPILGDLILRAYLIRRSLLIGLGTGFRIIGSSFAPDSRRLREFAARNRLPHRWTDLEQDRHAEELLRRFGVRPAETPVVIWHGDLLLRNPSNAELARVIGLRTRTPRASYDLAVIGAGPAGLAAAVYGAADGLAITTLEAVATGGQAGTSSRIENYLGFPSGISGAELAERAALQAQKFGVHIAVPADVAALDLRDGNYMVSLTDGNSVESRAVVLATGARYRKLNIPGIEKFEGTSVYYSATLHEARSCRLHTVAVVGAGNSGGQATLFLAEHTQRVYLVVRENELGTSMSRYLVDQIEHHPRVEVLPETEVREAIGAGSLEALVVEHHRTGTRSVLDVHALFVFIGAAPCTQWLGNTLGLDDQGFVLTGALASRMAPTELWEHVGREPYVLETSLPGVFATGDVRSGSVKRVASAVGEGAMAVHLAREHLDRLGQPTG
jgi:thioredoxin reductase (NADPH)